MTMPAPDHIPPALVVDFDFLNPPLLHEDVQAGWYQVKQQHPPLFWTARNGGHWVATRAADIRMIEADPARFSSHVPVLPYDRAGAVPTPPFDLDPPEQTQYRRLIAPSFTPKVVVQVEDRLREIAVQAIEGFHARGECEFMSEFARVLPIVTFLGMMGLPTADSDYLLPLTEKVARGTLDERRAAMREIAGYLSKFIAERTREPGEDPISRIVTSEIDGAPITAEKAIQTTAFLLAAGLDTVAALLGFVARFLANNPEHRRRLVDDPAIRPKAVEEFLRRFGILNHTRLVKDDTEIDGVFLKGGDIIYIATTLVGLDDELNDEPLKVDFDRPKINHGAFGNGVHRCPGAVLAQKEILVFLDEWLPRIPDFGMKPGTSPTVTSGTVSTHGTLYLSWRD
jgi:cytochrome P450